MEKSLRNLQLESELKSCPDFKGTVTTFPATEIWLPDFDEEVFRIIGRHLQEVVTQVSILDLPLLITKDRVWIAEAYNLQIEFQDLPSAIMLLLANDDFIFIRGLLFQRNLGAWVFRQSSNELIVPLSLLERNVRVMEFLRSLEERYRIVNSDQRFLRSPKPFPRRK